MLVSLSLCTEAENVFCLGRLTYDLTLNLDLVFARYTCKQVYTVFVNPVVIALDEALNLN